MCSRAVSARTASVFTLALMLVEGCSCRVNEANITQEEVFDQIDDELENVVIRLDTEVEPGEPDPRLALLSGKWAMKVVSSTISESVGGLGETLTEGETWFLVERTIDDDDQELIEEQILCGGEQYEARGTQSTMPIETYQSLPSNTLSRTTLDIDGGLYDVDDLVELWGIEMDDPFSNDFPESRDEAESEPFASRIYDMDDDGEPGVAINVSGIWDGTLHFVRQKVTDLDGRVIQNPDDDAIYFFGLTEHVIRRDLNLKAEGVGSGLIPEKVDYWQNTDARKNYFEMVQLSDEADCDTVIEVIADEAKICNKNPFIAEPGELTCFINSLIGGTEAEDEL